ncbi:MAG: hypothetical protein KC483_09185 [Nitrosarchaeum sp.]|nr:hypothetical protein [Nitrosarchaeum sp.]
MEAVDLVVTAIQDEMGEGKILEAIKLCTSTEHETPSKSEDFMVIYVLYEPFDYKQIFGQNYKAGKEVQNVRILLMNNYGVGFKELKDDVNRQKTLETKLVLDKVMTVLLKKVRDSNGFSSLDPVEPATKEDAVVGKFNVLYLETLLEITFLNNS